jgi:hypothetical protein
VSGGGTRRAEAPVPCVQDQRNGVSVDTTFSHDAAGNLTSVTEEKNQTTTSDLARQGMGQPDHGRPGGRVVRDTCVTPAPISA